MVSTLMAGCDFGLVAFPVAAGRRFPAPRVSAATGGACFGFAGEIMTGSSVAGLCPLPGPACTANSANARLSGSAEPDSQFRFGKNGSAKRLQPRQGAEHSRIPDIGTVLLDGE